MNKRTASVNRRVNVTQAMLSDVPALCELLADRDNESAQRFYQRHGFSISPMIPLRLLLSEPDVEAHLS